MNKTKESVIEGNGRKPTGNGNDRSEPSKHRSTGPRTAAGKHRSSRNAVKHGIFSKEILAGSGLGKLHEAFLKDSFQLHQPVGPNERSLVERLAYLSLSLERLQMAESAQRLLDATFLENDQQFKDIRELGEARKARCNDQSEEFITGLFYRSENPAIRDRCLEYLTRITAELSKDDFELDTLSLLVALVYGGCPSAVMAEIKKRKLERTTPSPNKDAFLEETFRDYAKLMSDAEVQGKFEARRFELRRLSLLVPDSSHVDRLIRYGAYLSREFDRTLNRLERLQRMRRGQPAPPTLNVNVS
jgi:hypothetical protein